MSFAVVFPGQGSQSVGMLAGLAAEDGIVRQSFEEASSALGLDLWQLTQEGPAERLSATEHTQPAMLAAGIATWRLWQKRGGGTPAFMSGHSLGELTALTAAGALDFPEAVQLVRLRGQAMQAAVPQGVGAMHVVLGLEDAQVEEACREAAAQGGVVEAVNYNAPGQVVIAGEAAAVVRAGEVALRLGARRVQPIPVSVPAHSTLMREAGVRLGEALARIRVRPPQIPYLSAVDAQSHDDPDDIRGLLVRQLSSPVRWSDTVRALAAQGAAAVLECGPGKVLTGLNRRILGRDGPEVLALEDAASLSAALTRTA